MCMGGNVPGGSATGTLTGMGALEGKVAVVTAAPWRRARAPGAAIFRPGGRPWVVADIDEDGGRATVALWSRRVGSGVRRTDVSVPDDVAAMARFAAVDTFGGLDCAHNNAGSRHPWLHWPTNPDGRVAPDARRHAEAGSTTA